MTVVPGQYALRISRRNAMSGVYATGNGVDKVVTTAAAVPSTVDAQIWDVIAVEGKENVYTIVQRTYGSSSGGSWSLQDNSAVYPVPVVTSQEPAEWYIVVSKEDPGAFTIQLVTTALGVDRYVGANFEPANQVVVISIPVVAHPEQDIPQWRFVARNDI